MARAAFAGADVDVRAIAAVRATREATVKRAGESLPCILGTPQPGETLDGSTYAGEEEIALFPGDLPDDPEVLFKALHTAGEGAHAAGDAAGASAGRDGDPATTSLVPDLRFLRFRPPHLERTAEGLTLSLPHIRLDRALDFLIGDRLA